MNAITLYVKEAYNELVYKVTWPSFKELQNSAVVVLIATIIIALSVAGMDFISKTVLTELYNILGGN